MQAESHFPLKAFGHLAQEMSPRTTAIPRPRLPHRCISQPPRATALEGRLVIWRRFRRKIALKKRHYRRRDRRPIYPHISHPLPSSSREESHEREGCALQADTWTAIPDCGNERQFSKALGAKVGANRSGGVQGATSIDLRNYIESHVVHHNTERNKEPRMKMMRLSKRGGELLETKRLAN
jgi:hypothetical protein